MASDLRLYALLALKGKEGDGSDEEGEAANRVKTDSLLHLPELRDAKGAPGAAILQVGGRAGWERLPSADLALAIQAGEGASAAAAAAAAPRPPPAGAAGDASLPRAPSEPGPRAPKLRTDGARNLPGRAGRRLTGGAGSGPYRCQGAGWKAERDTPLTAAGTPVKTSGGAWGASGSGEKRAAAAAAEEAAAGSLGESEVDRRAGDPWKAGVFARGGAGLRRPRDARDRSTWSAVWLPRGDQRRRLQIHPQARRGEARRGGRPCLSLLPRPGNSVKSAGIEEGGKGGERERERRRKESSTGGRRSISCLGRCSSAFTPGGRGGRSSRRKHTPSRLFAREKWGWRCLYRAPAW
ncbi:uncharacterized protein PHA67_017568 [Liasis olivaceus]